MPHSIPTVLRLAPLASVLALACSAPAPADDAGLILGSLDSDLPDVGTDAGPPPNDSGDGLCADLSMLPFGTPPLPPECLPRCTSATRTAILACSDAACEQAAHAADTTPPVRFRTRYGIYSVSCDDAAPAYACYLWQLYSCFEEWCRPQFYTYSDCLDTGAACTTERDAVNTCMNGIPDAVACEQERVASCYASAP